MHQRPVVLLKGRLGNQLFQWAAAKGLAPDPEAPAVLDNRLRRRFGEPLTLALRPGEHRAVTQRELLRLRQLPRFPWYFQDAGLRGAALVPGLVALSESHSWRERDIGFDASVRDNLDRLLLGFFQDTRYFAHVGPRLLAGMRPASPAAAASMTDIRRRLRGRSTVAVTVRSGRDYDGYGWTLPAAYYLAAAGYVAGSVASPGFVVTGDVGRHVEVLASSLRSLGPVVTAADLPGLDQLHVVAEQEHVVVSNSTFSWWAAWLGDQRHPGDRARIVVTPDRWLPGHPHPAPPHWRRVPATLGDGWDTAAA